MQHGKLPDNKADEPTFILKGQTSSIAGSLFSGKVTVDHSDCLEFLGFGYFFHVFTLNQATNKVNGISSNPSKSKWFRAFPVHLSCSL